MAADLSASQSCETREIGRYVEGTFLVQGCNLSFVCGAGPSMLYLIQRIIDMGGVPEVHRWTGNHHA